MYIIKKHIKMQVSILLLLIMYPSIKTDINSYNNSTPSPSPLPVFVSLGRDCEPAKRLKMLELRTKAYPFDWNNTTCFSGVCDMIKDNFKDFLNPLFLKHNGKTILHTLYTIEFRHDFPSLAPHGDTGVVDFDTSWQQYYGGLIVDNFLDFLPTIAEKYTRRINRFVKLLNSTKKVVFIRTDLKPEEAKQFVTLMATYYPKLNYELIGLQNDNNIIFKLEQMPFVKICYPQTRLIDFVGWIQPQEWLEIMTKYGFK